MIPVQIWTCMKLSSSWLHIFFFFVLVSIRIHILTSTKKKSIGVELFCLLDQYDFKAHHQFEILQKIHAYSNLSISLSYAKGANEWNTLDIQRQTMRLRTTNTYEISIRLYDVKTCTCTGTTDKHIQLFAILRFFCLSTSRF